MPSLNALQVLLVDNDTDTLEQLKELCSHNDMHVTCVHATEAPVLPSQENYDCIILSGGMWYDDESKQRDTYAKEIELIRQSEVPVLGICLGMQLMQVAADGEVSHLAKPQTGLAPITVLPRGRELFGLPARLQVHKNHTRGIIMPPPGYEVLACTDDRAEIIRHTARPILGVQFHPELGAEPARSELFIVLMNELLARPKT